MAFGFWNMINHEFWMVQLGFTQKCWAHPGYGFWMVRITGPSEFPFDSGQRAHAIRSERPWDRRFRSVLDLLFAFLVCCVGKIREFPQHILTHSDTCANGGKSMNKDIRVSTMKKRYFPPVQMDLSVHTYQCIMILTMLYSSFTARQYGGPPGRRLG